MPLLPTLTTKLAGKITEAILKPSTNNIQTPSSEGKKDKKESITTQLIAAAKPIAVDLLGGKGKGKKESSHGAGGGIGIGAGGAGGHEGGRVYMSGGRGGRLSAAAASESGRGGERGGGSNASYYGYVNHDPHGVLQGRKRR